MTNLKTICLLSVATIGTSPLALGQQDTEGPQKKDEGWFYGVFATHYERAYRDLDSETKAFPAIGYKGPKFSVMGPRASYVLSNDQSQNIKTSINLQYRSLGFDAEESSYFSGLRDRKDTALAGINAEKKLGRWTYTASFSKDILGRSDGDELKISTSFFHNIGPLFITPKASISYLNDNFTDYYYGVSQDEALPNRPAYQASDAFNLSLSLNLATPIFFGGFSRLSITQHWLDNDISDSPLVDDDQTWKMTFSFTRFF